MHYRWFYILNTFTDIKIYIGCYIYTHINIYKNRLKKQSLYKHSHLLSFVANLLAGKKPLPYYTQGSHINICISMVLYYGEKGKSLVY